MSAKPPQSSTFGLQFQWLPGVYVGRYGSTWGVSIGSLTFTLSLSRRLDGRSHHQSELVQLYLRQVEGVNFGPDAITWQALVTSLAGAREEFWYGDESIPMCAVTIESGELGNLINPQDREMVDLLVTLWDGRVTFTKQTKMSGNDTVENPWVNIIACTTPTWIAGNFPQYMVGGGFTSRCVFVMADEKEKYIAYPYKHAPRTDKETRAKLVADLQHIATSIVGPYTLTREAEDWGTDWYRRHEESLKTHPLNDDRFGGYLARKQSHLHKLAMILAAAQRDETILTKEDLMAANGFVENLEEDMPKVFAQIGRGEEAMVAERLVSYVTRNGRVTIGQAFSLLFQSYPDANKLMGIISAAIKAEKIVAQNMGGTEFLYNPAILKQMQAGISVPLTTDAGGGK